MVVTDRRCRPPLALVASAAVHADLGGAETNTNVRIP